jgi:large subunit ribosomal protein L25
MAENFEVIAETRTDLGKGASRRLRHADKVPGVVYGSGEPVSITMAHSDMLKHVANEAFFSHVLDLQIDGKSEMAIVRDMQRHPAKQIIMHIDFMRVKKGVALHMNVPLHFINEDICAGVKVGGGLLSHLITEIEIACLPKDLPEFIEVDVATLELGSTLHMSEIVLPKGITSVALSHGEDHDMGVVTCSKPRGAEEEESTEAATTEEAASE